MCLKQYKILTGFAQSAVVFATVVCAAKQKVGLQLDPFTGRYVYPGAISFFDSPFTIFTKRANSKRFSSVDQISSLGYKSVAHYLMQTRRSNPDSDKTAGMKVPVSAKRSLPFSDFDATPQKDDLSQLDRESSGTTNPQLTIKNDFPCTESSKAHKNLSISKPEFLRSDDELETCTNKNSAASKTSLKSSKKRAQPGPSTDSIGGRLRQRRRQNSNNSQTN